MIRVCVRGADGALSQGGEELLSSLGSKWVDLVGPTEATMAKLAGPFGLHKLAVEDCLHLGQRPKLEEYPGHVFLVLHGFLAAPEDLCDLTLLEMHFFIGPDWLITVHEKPNAAQESTWARVLQSPSDTLGRGPDFVAYLVADAMVDSNFPILDRFNDSLEELEDQIFLAPSQKQLERTFELKRLLVGLRRVLSPQRDIVGLLAKRGIPQVQERTVLYFRDVYDHLVRLYEQIDTGRDILGSVVDGYLSMVANKTNEVTKQLTIFATIFLPLSFITGFFGQNFEVLSHPSMFWTMMALVFLLPVGLLAWFKARHWI